MAEQCGVNSRQNLEAKARRRAELREIFIKQSTNPHQHATGSGGSVFDAAIHRFMAMRSNRYDHFRPTPKNVRAGLFLVIVPFCAFGYALHWERTTKEHKFRTGQVAYKDRAFKFI